MTLQEIINLNQALNQLGHLSGVKFSYAVAKNIAKIKPELEAIDLAFAPTDEYKKFDELRVELAKLHAKKDEAGNPVSKDNQFVMENPESFQSALAPLMAEYKDACDKREEQMKEYLDLLKTESKVDLHKVFIDDVPKEITVAQMYSIEPIVSELPIL